MQKYFDGIYLGLPLGVGGWDNWFQTGHQHTALWAQLPDRSPLPLHHRATSLTYTGAPRNYNR